MEAKDLSAAVPAAVARVVANDAEDNTEEDAGLQTAVGAGKMVMVAVKGEARLTNPALDSSRPTSVVEC